MTVLAKLIPKIKAPKTMSRQANNTNTHIIGLEIVVESRESFIRIRPVCMHV